MTMIGIVLLAAVVIAFWLIMTFNGLVQKRVRCEQAWADITVQLKRRYDLIPNLVETVKGYASHERETLERVIAARNSAVQSVSSGAPPAEVAKADGAVSGALRQLFALSESYPDLKANQGFLDLQQQLTQTENLIAGARSDYNQAVGSYNASREQLPGNFVVGFGDFPKKAFFELSAEEQTVVASAPKVAF